jgi:hypothetical protein
MIFAAIKSGDLFVADGHNPVKTDNISIPDHFSKK